VAGWVVDKQDEMEGWLSLAQSTPEQNIRHSQPSKATTKTHETCQSALSTSCVLRREYVVTGIHSLLSAVGGNYRRKSERWG
jgi:hypothetical protein